MRQQRPFIHDEHLGDEVFGFFGRICKLWLIKVPLGSQNVVEGLVVVVTEERRETAETERKRSILFVFIPPTCTWTPSDARLQHVRDDAEAPHVRVERDKVIVDYLGSEELWSTEIHPKLFPRFVAV